MFTEDDLKQHKLLDESISKFGSWKASTPELIQIFKSLVWFNQLKDKISQNIMEVKSIKQVKKPEVSE